jgi:hypothetical protein
MIATPIVHEPVQSAVLAGDTILVASGPRVVAFPQRKLVFSTATGDITLAASPLRVAAIVKDEHGGQAFSGPPLGPWTALAGARPIKNEIDGDRLFTRDRRARPQGRRARPRPARGRRRDERGDLRR